MNSYRKYLKKKKGKAPPQTEKHPNEHKTPCKTVLNLCKIVLCVYTDSSGEPHLSVVVFPHLMLFSFDQN